MPIHQGNDKKGSYYQWGESGKKYYFNQNSIRSMKIEHNKALRQAGAIYANHSQNLK